MIEIHDVVIAYQEIPVLGWIPDTHFYIVGRVSFLDYKPKSTEVESYGVTHYDKNNQVVEITVNHKDVKLVNTQASHRNSLLPVPSIDELEERYYAKYSENHDTDNMEG